MKPKNKTELDGVIDYLNQVIKSPAEFDFPTWSKLEQLSSKSRATLWRNSTIYELYINSREAKKVWQKKVGTLSKGYRRTLEEKIIFLEQELAMANRIADAHIRNYITICRNAERLNIDPSILLADLPSPDEFHKK